MKRLVYLFLALAMTSSLLLACNNGDNGGPGNDVEVGQKVEVEGGAYWEASPSEIYSILDGNIFVFQYDIMNLGNIPNTDEFIQYKTLEENMDKLPADKNTTIVIFCGVGEKSAEAAEFLVKEGYTRVHNLDGGSIAWRDEGYPVIS